MAVFVLKSINRLKLLVKTFIFVLALPFSNAFIEGFGQVFNGMGDQMTDFVDNLYKNVDSWADHIIEHAKEEECHFICPNGKISAENKSYGHNSTGCGTFGIQIKDSDLPIKEVRICCDGHQICYHRCGADKNQCDKKLNQCLIEKCKETQPDKSHLKGCETATKLLLMSFLTFGCKTYKDSQKKACLCIGSDEL